MPKTIIASDDGMKATECGANYISIQICLSVGGSRYDVAEWTRRLRQFADTVAERLEVLEDEAVSDGDRIMGVNHANLA